MARDYLQRAKDIESTAGEQGDYEAAREYYERALDIFRTIGDRAGEGITLINLGRIARYRGELDTAEESYEDSLAIYRDLGDPEGEATALTNLGKISRDRGKFDTAEEYYEDSLAIYRDHDDRKGEAQTLTNLGQLSRDRGDFYTAEQYYEDSLAIKREIGDRAGEANTFNNLGALHEASGEWTAAEDYYEDSLAIYRDLGDPEGEATALTNLGKISRDRGKFDTAQEYYEDSLAIYRDLDDRKGEAQTLNNLGEVERLQSDYEAARDYYERSLAIKRELGDRAGEARTLNNLGVVAQSQSDYDAAREYYERSLAVKRDLGDRAGEAQTLNNLGEVARQQGDYDAARDYYEDAADIFDEIGAIRELLQTHQNLARVSAQQNDLESAIEWCETGLSTIEQADIAGLEDERQTFEPILNQLQAPERPFEDLYANALENVLDNEGGTALQFFRHAWEKRDEVSEDQHPTAVAAGVGVAAHVELFDDEGSDEDEREILDEIEPDRDLLSEPADAVFEYLVEGEVDTTPEQLLEATAPELAEADEISSEDLDRDELEALAFARLLEVLTDSGPESPEEVVVAGYAQALQHILESEGQEAMQTLYAVWKQRDSADADSQAFSAALAAGVGFAAHTRFVDDEQADEDRQKILDEIAQHEDRLAQPELALYEHLTEGETDTTPEDLQDGVDEDGGELDLIDVEYVAYAGLLEALQELDEVQ